MLFLDTACNMIDKCCRFRYTKKLYSHEHTRRGVSVKAGTPPGTPGTPGTLPGTPGTLPGTPGTLPGTPGTLPGTPGTPPGTPGTPPGTPGTPPGTPGTPPGTRWNTSYEATHVFLYKFTCFALNSGVLDGYDLYFHLYFCSFK